MSQIEALRDRRFPARMVRAYCDRVYGKTISDDGWNSWRKWIGVKRRSRTYSFDQFALIAAIAHIRSLPGNLRRKKNVLLFEVKRLAKQLEHQQRIADAIALCDSVGIISGQDAVTALSLKGIKTSRRSLYRKVPAFSTQKEYKLDYLARFVA